MKRLIMVRPGFSPSSCVKAMLAIGVLLLGTADLALAGTVARDHRGPNGAPTGGVTVNGHKATVRPAPKLGGPRWHGGYDNLDGPKGAGAIVRDHRT